MQKSKKNNDRILRKVQKPSFWAKLAQNGPKIIFLKQQTESICRVYSPLISCEKSEKNNDTSLSKRTKTPFVAQIGPKRANKFFPEKNSCVTFSGL